MVAMIAFSLFCENCPDGLPADSQEVAQLAEPYLDQVLPDGEDVGVYITKTLRALLAASSAAQEGG